MFFLIAAVAAVPMIHLESEVSPANVAGWTRGIRPDPTSKLEILIAVKQQRVDDLAATLAMVADPRNKRYGRHLSNSAVNELIQPSEASSEAVRSAFEGAKPLTPNGDMLSLTATVAEAEALLACRYYVWSHKDGNATAIRADSYSLPANVAAHIDFVSPTVRLPPVAKLRSRLHSPNANAFLNTPDRLRKLYKVGNATGRVPFNRQAVTAFLGQKFSDDDLQTFYSLFYPSLANKTVKMVGDPGGTRTFGSIEAMLDAEYMSSLGDSVATEFWYFAGRAPDNPDNEPFLKWLTLLASTSNAPTVFSTSYGEDEDSVSAAYAERINTEFMKAGARGISLLFASGDGGAHGQTPCRSGGFMAQFPAASPYVTSVGGTTGSPEEAVGLSGGGFSNRYGTAPWQREAVAGYLRSSRLPDSSLFNASGRGFPDLAAQATGYAVVAVHVPTPVDGTSCASPTAGGIVALLNDIRLAAGKSPLGFLNPFLYQHPNAFNDIVSGSNGGCKLDRGFYAEKGWDAVTGLGTPDYGKLAAAVSALP